MFAKGYPSIGDSLRNLKQTFIVGNWATTSYQLKVGRDLKIPRRRWQRERKKKTIGLIIKTTTLHAQHAFLYISLPSLHDCDAKISNFTFHGGRKQATTKFSFFLNLDKAPSGSTPGEFQSI